MALAFMDGHEIESIRRFAQFNSVLDALPDETTILNFRHLLEAHKLTEQLLETINNHLKDKGLLVSQGTMVDATIIHAPSSTKNRDKARDPDMHQTRKGNQWYFGMKVHVGADVDSGAVHRRGARYMGLLWYVNDKRKGSRNLSSSQRKRNRKQSSVRARVEHVFRVIKRQFGFQKTRYRGIEKNASQVNLLVGLANLYMLRRQLVEV